MPVKLLLYVQHLLGIGHARRAALLAQALAGAGVEVTVAQGGFPVAGVEYGAARVVQLPPARAADAGFRLIVDAAGAPIDHPWKKRRAAELLALQAGLRPDILLIETFPFGRRKFLFELRPLLEIARRARPRPLIACSVRDILVAKADPEKETAMAAMARAWFDLVLVHGDPEVIPFGASFPPAATIADLIRYTGYVAPPRDAGPAEPPDGDGRDEVVVSVGGGAVGEELLRAALAARGLLGPPLGAARWRLLAGPDLPPGVPAELRAAAPEGVVVEPARPDFPALLRRCRVSVSQAGYNTVLDVLAAGCPSVLVPFAAGGETEQTERARLLAARGLALVVPEAGLTPQTLAEAVAAAFAAPRPAGTGRAAAIRLDGAAETVRLLLAALDVRRDAPDLNEEMVS